MTRLMAFTQSSMSLWELAMSRKDSWLIAALSFSPAETENKRGDLSDEGIHGFSSMHLCLLLTDTYLPSYFLLQEFHFKSILKLNMYKLLSIAVIARN